MFDTMYANQGIGLAANQVGLPHRILTLDISDDGNQPVVLVNPVILQSTGEQSSQEGCLSLPGIYPRVVRPQSLLVEANDLEGNTRQFWADGLLAVVIAHEMAHLDGKLFIDELSPLKQARYVKRVKKHLGHK